MALTDTLDFLAAMKEQTGNVAEHVALEFIQPDPSQPRKLRPENDEELQGLADNIFANGLINPITVRRDAENPAIFRIISGERRWRAAKLAGLKAIPCRIMAFADDVALKLAQLSENIQREDMALFDTAQALKQLMEQSGLKQKDLAARLGKREDYVSGMLLVAKAQGVLKEAVEDGVVRSPYAFRLLTQLPAEEQKRAVHGARAAKRSLGRTELMQALGRQKKGQGAKAAEAAAAATATANSTQPEALSFSLSLAEAQYLFDLLDLPTPRSQAEYAPALRKFLRRK